MSTIIRQIQKRPTPPERLEDGWLHWTRHGWDLRFFDPARRRWVSIFEHCEQSLFHEFYFRQETSLGVDKAVDEYFKVKGKEHSLILEG